MDFKRALQLDALDNSHPIEVPVGHPDEVDEIFDAISYCKGIVPSHCHTFTVKVLSQCHTATVTVSRSYCHSVTQLLSHSNCHSVTQLLLPGNSVIRMLHNWLGAEPFRTGLAAYLKKHKYSNALTEDLWASLEATSGKPVNKVTLCLNYITYALSRPSYGPLELTDILSSK